MTRTGRSPVFLAAAIVSWLPAIGCESRTTPEAAPNATVATTPERQVEPTSAANGGTYFRDVAEEAGIRFVLETRLDDTPQLPEIVAGGGAAADFDGDGLLDLLLVQGTGADGHRLFRNLGDWRFEDVTEGSGLTDVARFGMGAATGDIDGDGDLDLLVTNLGPDTLFRNEGGFRFTDVTASAGLESDAFGASASFFDADGDGDLDLYVTNYVDWSPEGELDCRRASGERDYCAPARYEAPTIDRLHLNRGDGTFEDATVAAGIGADAGTGLGVAAVDVDDDGLLDLFVANDGMPDHLWMNRGGGRFEENATRAGCDRDLSGVAKAGMGVAIEDLDDDGDPDILVCNLGGETDSLYLNEGGRFVDATSRSGLAAASRRYTRFGLAFLDLDLDGRLDLYAATGRVGVGGRTLDPADPYAEPDLLLRGGEDGRFRAVGPAEGFESAIRTSRGLVVGDFDDDGRPDLVVVDREAPTRVLRNMVDTPGRWLGLDVRDDAGGPAFHARIAARIDDRTLTRWVRTDSSYLSARDPRVHLGLGEVEVAPAVEVRWPDGRTRFLEGLELDRYHRIDPPRRDAGSRAGDGKPGGAPARTTGGDLG